MPGFLGSLVVGCLLLLAACERPFVDVRPPGLDIIEPEDFSTVFTRPELHIRIGASSFRAVSRLEINGDALPFNESQGWWEDSLRLRRGLNRLVISAFDIEDVAEYDTVYAVYLPFRYALNAPPLPEGRGGHAATLMANRALLVTGGAASARGPAENDVFLLRPDALAFERFPVLLRQPRTGHTATLLPDGRVLVIGGSRRDDFDSVNDFAGSVEVLDLEKTTSSPVPLVSLDGVPLAMQRALHTASARTTEDGVIIDLFGGRGANGDRVYTRDDVSRYLFRSDTLFALDSRFGWVSLEPTDGHTQTALDTRDAADAGGRYLVAGSQFFNASHEDVDVTIDFSPNRDVFVDTAPSLRIPRTRHAAAPLDPGYVFLFGGNQGAPGLALNAAELYIGTSNGRRINRFFRLPDVTAALVPNSDVPVKRSGHTATKLSGQRILIVGGFSVGGNSVAASEYFDAGLF